MLSYNTLLILEDKILSITGNKLALYGLPEPVHDQPELTSKDVLRETSCDVQALQVYMAANVPRLIPDQQQAFIAITGIIGSERRHCLFGCTRWHRQDFSVFVAVASSGIAATLLAGGRTAYSAFRVATGIGQIRPRHLQYFQGAQDRDMISKPAS
ncbi:hypothetical protein TNCV_3322661 [Trichonephila clavipes]|nr:hypothetical protein TNCV_3322661 [Trichonephila clavipes]